MHSLPWRVWTGTGWEKHQGNEEVTAPLNSSDVDLESGLSQNVTDLAQEGPEHNPSTSMPEQSLDQPWFEAQVRV